MHAYWAPNVWALYTFTDKILSIGKVVESEGEGEGEGEEKAKKKKK